MLPRSPAADDAAGTMRAVALACLLAGVLPGAAEADWLITPFIGVKFAGDTSFADLDRAAGKKKLTVGGAVGWLGEGIFGLEADFSHVPGFFERDVPLPLVLGSWVSTLTGNVLIAIPVSVTRESLRPYAVGGLGLMRARSEGAASALVIDGNLFALGVGGGAIGDISDVTSLRFDARYFTNLGRQDPGATFGVPHLRFWRATVGLTLRY